MKFELKKIFCLLTISLFSIIGCTSSDINSEIPVSSNDLIDENIVYKSETVKVDIEEASSSSSDFAKKENNELINEKVEEVKKEDNIVITKNEMEVIVPPPAENDTTIDFVETSYNEPKDFDFEMAVMQAQQRRGIKPKYFEKPIVKKEIIEPKQQPAFNKKLNIKPVDERSITFLSTIVYHSNTKADISTRDLKALKNVAKFVNKNNAIVKVVGNSSSRSKDMKEIQNKMANFDLSLLRAQKVADALVKAGVSRDKIFITAASDTEKIVEENMPINEAINRRTEIYINY